MTNATFAHHMRHPADLSEDQQKRAGTPTAGDMSERHKKFVADVARMLEEGTIDVTRVATFIIPEAYEKLDSVWKTKVDRILPNMATLLTHIHAFYRSKQTPDACPQLASMIEHLWEMKERIESHADVFVF